MQTTRYVYLNGQILPAEQASISPFDLGLLRGYGVFDLLQTINGTPFLLPEHLERFRASADTLGLTVPVTDSEITEALLELLELNRHVEATVRMVLTGGESPDGMTFDPSSPTFYIVTHELFDVPEHVYESGAKLITAEHRREFPQAKTTNYLTWVQHHPRIAAAGAMDVLYHSDGIVSECATASFYVVIDGAIHAPAEGVLRGTVGQYVLDLARPRFEVVLGELTLQETLDADEAFLTSSVRGVVPVVALDDHAIGDGAVGPVTSELMALYRASVRDR